MEEVRISAKETISIGDLILTNLEFIPIIDNNRKIIAIAILFDSYPASTGKVEVLTLKGALVKTIVEDANFKKGQNKIVWDLTDNNGQPVPNGIYLVRVTARALSSTETLTKTLTVKRKFP